MRTGGVFRKILVMMAIPLAFPAQGQETSAPEFEWNVNGDVVFDNREGDSKLTATKTFFQTQLSPEIGLSLMDGVHTLMGGAVWTQPLGSDWKEGTLAPTIYYRYHKGGLSGELGMFPKDYMKRPLPDYVWSDSVNYCQRNIRGAMLTYETGHGWLEALVDWRGMQSRTRREAFNVIAHGEWQEGKSLLLAGGLAMMNHHALTEHSPADEHITDNFVLNPYIGVDLSGKCALDSLTIRAGWLGAFTRYRGDRSWKCPGGVRVEAGFQWKWLGINESLYAGGKLFPYYGLFKWELDQGEPYYQSNWYNRTTIYANLLKKDFVVLQGAIDLNFAKSNFTWYQKLLLSFNIGSTKRKARPLTE